MISRHFALNSELTGAIAKKLPHAKNQPSAPGSFFNQFVTYIYNNRVLIVRIYIRIYMCPPAAQRKQAKRPCLFLNAV